VILDRNRCRGEKDGSDLRRRIAMHAFLVLSAASAAGAADFTGRWKGAIVRSDGGRREYEIVLKQQEGKLTGLIVTPGGELTIDVGSVDGDVATITAQNRRFVARLVGEELHLSIPGSRGSTQEVVAHLDSRDPTPTPRPPISLPEIRPLPPNGLAQTPPMGWNSWNKFRTGINAQLIREIADAMVATGMQKAGYSFVNIDDGWEGSRDGAGAIRSNERFPDMKALADYVHSKGLKLGIYSSPGPRTCAGFEGSFNHEAQDARTFSEWGIDYIKYDWCTAPVAYKTDQMRAVYQKMGEAIRATKRPIVYSLCQYGRERVEEWGASVGGNLWRTTGDIGDRWDSMASIGFDKQAGLESSAGPGHWNDPDMLEIGNGGMTDDEYRSHMSLWAMLAAPLIAGNDLRSMTPPTREILTNPEVIAIDQDALGREGKRVSKSGDAEVWARTLRDGSYAIALFNRGTQAASVTARWEDVGIVGEYGVRDVWSHEARGPHDKEYSTTVAPHAVVLLRLAKEPRSASPR